MLKIRIKIALKLPSKLLYSSKYLVVSEKCFILCKCMKSRGKKKSHYRICYVELCLKKMLFAAMLLISSDTCIRSLKKSLVIFVLLLPSV